MQLPPTEPGRVTHNLFRRTKEPSMTPQQLAAAITADDALLDHLGSATPIRTDDPLAELLHDWRGEIESLGYSDLVDLDTAVATIAYATRSWWTTDTGVRTAALLLFLAVITAVAVALTLAERGVL